MVADISVYVLYSILAKYMIFHRPISWYISKYTGNLTHLKLQIIFYMQTY